MERNEAIQRQFGAVADRYRASRYHAAAPDLEAMLAAQCLRGDERVLDLGTGTGHTALYFAPHVREVLGCDLTAAMLEQARDLAKQRGCSNVRFEQADAMALPYPDDAFDGITCRVCAHHFAEPRAAVREAARVLRPGGWLLWVDSVSPPDAAADTFLNTIELLRDPSHVRDHTIAQWQQWFGAEGIVVAHEATWGVPLDFDDWTERMQTPEPERAALRRLFDRAPESQREAFALRTGARYAFEMPIALLRGQLARA